MSGNLQLAADAIGAKAAEVSGIDTIETKPKMSTTRKLPAIFVTYLSFHEKALTFGPSSLMTYDFQLTLYLKLDGRNLEKQYTAVLDLVNKIVDTFRNSFTLDGVVMKAEIKTGRMVIDIPKNPDAQPLWIGHRFALEVSFEES
jgi:hypothetical protein